MGNSLEYRQERYSRILETCAYEPRLKFAVDFPHDAGKVLGHILWIASREFGDGEFSEAIPTIMQECHIGEARARAALKYLRDNKLIVCIRENKGGSGKEATNVYLPDYDVIEKMGRTFRQSLPSRGIKIDTPNDGGIRNDTVGVSEMIHQNELGVSEMIHEGEFLESRESAIPAHRSPEEVRNILIKTTGIEYGKDEKFMTACRELAKLENGNETIEKFAKYYANNKNEKIRGRIQQWLSYPNDMWQDGQYASDWKKYVQHNKKDNAKLNRLMAQGL